MPDLPKLKSFPIWAKTFESGVFVITSKPNIKKIRKKINNLLGEEMGEHYIIAGANGEVKKIGVDRNLISFVK
jgi:hypothetical protein